MATTERTGPVTRNDIESKLREIRGEVEATSDAAKPAVAGVVAVAAVVVIAVAFVLGRRSGRRRNTVVEIRRV